MILKLQSEGVPVDRYQMNSHPQAFLNNAEVMRLVREKQMAALPITVVRGPRQIGKTTLLNQIIDDLLTQGVAPKRIFRVQFDELPELEKVAQPILDLAWWYGDNILGKSFHQAAKDGEQALLFLNEVQNLPAWAPQLKNLVDQHPVRVVVTGSPTTLVKQPSTSATRRAPRPWTA